MQLQIGIGNSTTFWNPQSPLLEDEDRAGERREWRYRLEYGAYYIMESVVSSLKDEDGRGGSELGRDYRLECGAVLRSGICSFHR